MNSYQGHIFICFLAFIQKPKFFFDIRLYLFEQQGKVNLQFFFTYFFIKVKTIYIKQLDLLRLFANACG
ncbi:unnamed protein product [Blepharisma stoltei]|uniref:Uncharacterized protein n=1 Tax=Blepharisma stoltei TaxID=1481888 RepID=A0AAU9JKU9_9CILI|nr:unnamed protein product [Blepharisma stoltei]